MLPLTLRFEEFNGREKISYLPRPLDDQRAPGSDPEDGDLIYYTPWGNLGFYYDAAGIGYSDQVIHLGTYNATLDRLSSLEGNDVTVRIVRWRQALRALHGRPARRGAEVPVAAGLPDTSVDEPEDDPAQGDRHGEHDERLAVPGDQIGTIGGTDDGDGDGDAEGRGDVADGVEGGVDLAVEIGADPADDAAVQWRVGE